MKITWVTFGLGWLAILGIPPFSGFWSKDKIIEAAFIGEGWRPWVFGAAALIGAGITAFYMSRLFFMTFHGKKRWTDEPAPARVAADDDRADDRPGGRLGVLGLVLGVDRHVRQWLEPVVGGARRGAPGAARTGPHRR